MDEMCHMYHSVEAASGTLSDYTDITTVAAWAALFTGGANGGVRVSKRTIIRTDAAIEVKFNDSSNGPISIAANAQMEVNWLFVSKIFVKAGSGSNLKIIVAR